MRLKKEHVDKVATQILRVLKGKNLIRPRVTETKIHEKIVQVITADLMAEVKLEDDARKLLDNYRDQINSGEIDERKAFLMIKKQLAKERKMVL